MTATLNKNNVIQVSDEVLARIKSLAQTHHYTTNSDLYYEDHIPVVAYLIIEGSGHLFKRRRKNIPLKSGDLVGLIELITHQSSVYGAKVNAGSQVIFLDRSTIQEILNHDVDIDLKQIFESLLISA